MVAMSHNYDRSKTAAIGPTPSNRAGQTMGIPIKLTQKAQKAFMADKPNEALDYLSTCMAHLETVMLELGLPTANLRKVNLDLRGQAKSYKPDPV